jgi:hypothetical protein
MLRLGVADAGSAWRSGVEYKARYGKLLREGEGIFTRSAGGDRVVETGQYWLEVSTSRQDFRARADVRRGLMGTNSGFDLSLISLLSMWSYQRRM